MQILVVDESEKKAWRKSRRLRGTLLYRRGSRTYSGRLTAEGIPGLEKLLRLLVRLAALFHDLGKGNDQFQAMLRGKAGYQHLRHELVSLLMLDAATKGVPDVFQALIDDAPALFAALPGKLPATPIPAHGFTVADTEQLASDLLSGVLAPSERGLFDGIRYLVLTHHRPIAPTPPVDRSPAGRRAHQHQLRLMSGTPSLCRQINELTEGPATLDPRNLALAAAGQPWEDNAWLASVQANARRVKRLLADNPSLLDQIAKDPVAWAKNMALIARPSLILADHLASALKTADAAPAGGAYANTVLNHLEQPVLADTLPVHLLKTRYAADPFFKGLSGRHKPLPAWRPPAESVLYQTGGPERFRWQDDAAALVRAVPGIADRPFMAMVVSSTGAGKTLGAPKILAAAGADRLRYTCALGLRSLTLQTGAAYRQQLGLDDATAMTVVGDALYAKLSTDPRSATPASMGSESLEDGAALVLDGSPAGVGLAAALEMDLRLQAELRQSTALAMAEVPILTCTVDHVIRASALERGTDVRMSLRLATADLVLDEIDNYSLEDLQALARLVHAAGCYGRRVVLMSATVSETVLRGLYDAWRSGLESWALRTGNNLAPVVALVSNQVPSRVLTAAADVETALPRFIQDLSGALAGATPKTKAKVVPVKSDLKATFQALFEQAIQFARWHHTVDPSTGQALSAGFVRFNQVKHCRQFARFLMDEVVVPVDVSLKVQCYHRRMPLFHLATIEKTLNDLWARHDEQRIFSHPVIKAWTTTAPLRVVIVATTSIQETGRDHDYDFAIAEPWSTRSLVQLAGRVRRHRGPGTDLPNVGLFDKELNQLDTKKSRYCGLEVGREALCLESGNDYTLESLTDSRDRKFSPMWAGLLKSGRAPITAPKDSTARGAWFPAYFYAQGIDARPCLSPTDGASAPLPYLEHFAQERRVARPPGRPWFLSMADFWGKQGDHVELLWNRHNTVVQFRRQTAAQVQFTLDPLRTFQQLAVVTRHPDTGAVQLTPRFTATDWAGGTCIKNLDRCLLRIDLLTERDVYDALGRTSNKSLAAKLSHAFEAYVKPEDAMTKHVDFDPLLGADTHSSAL